MKKSSHLPHLKTACTASNSKLNKQNFEIYKIENNAEWPTHFYKMIELNRKRKKTKTWAIKQQGLYNKVNQDCYTDNIFMILKKKKENVTKRFPNQKN